MKPNFAAMAAKVVVFTPMRMAKTTELDPSRLQSNTGIRHYAAPMVADEKTPNNHGASTAASKAANVQIA